MRRRAGRDVWRVRAGVHPCRSAVVRLRRPLHPTGYDVGFRRWATIRGSRGNTTCGQAFSIIAAPRDINGGPPSLSLRVLHAHRRAGLGAAGRHPREWRRIQARRLMCLLLVRALCSADARRGSRVPGLRGALSHFTSPHSTPITGHRVLLCWCWEPNIAVLLGCSKSSRQCDL